MPTIVETKTCPQSWKEFHIFQEELDLLDQIAPVLNGKKYPIPPSKYHPSVQMQHLMAWRNEMYLYHNTDCFTGKSLISTLSPESGYQVCEHDAYRTDACDGFAYGSVYDDQASFFDQFDQLMHAMPQMSLFNNISMEDCYRCNYGFHAKHCYVCQGPTYDEHCLYSGSSINCLWDVDGYRTDYSEYTYECFYGRKLYACQRVMYSENCKHSAYLLDCKDCEYCYGCCNMNHKKYYIFNEPYSQEDYETKIQELRAQDTNARMQQFREFSLQYPKRATRNKQVEATTGDLNENTENCQYCFGLMDMKDAYNCAFCGLQAADLWHCFAAGAGGTRAYLCAWYVGSDINLSCLGSTHTHRCYYCYYCRDCTDCFGCVGLQHQQYCVFNKQHTQEEYETLVVQIIESMQAEGAWGDFFPPSISPFPYQDSLAHERFPVNDETINSRGWKCKQEEKTPYTGEVYAPESIEVYKQDPAKQQELLNVTLVCEVSQRPFRIIRTELDFYIKFNLEIPRKAPLQRYKERTILWRMPIELYDRKCAKTWKTILSPYSPERPEEVWSEEAWDKEFLW